jgi:insulysin
MIEKFLWKLKTPQLKNRVLNKIKLSNGMNSVIISDKEATSSSACLSVEAGSFMDGKYEGTAHFLEHMLFLGTKKYPNECEYDRYIRDNNGYLNGYTANDHSMYFFDGISPASLEGIIKLSRFVGPLF